MATHATPARPALETSPAVAAHIKQAEEIISGLSTMAGRNGHVLTVSEQIGMAQLHLFLALAKDAYE